MYSVLSSLTMSLGQAFLCDCELWLLESENELSVTKQIIINGFNPFELRFSIFNPCGTCAWATSVKSICVGNCYALFYTLITYSIINMEIIYFNREREVKQFFA